MHILPAPNGIFQALKILQSGGVIAHATETCYGLACDMTNPEAMQKLFALKKRPPDMPVSALFASLDEAKKYVEWNELAEELAETYLPGPLTLILPPKADSPHRLYITPSIREIRNPKHEIRNIGIRVSSHPIAQHLAQEFGKPLSTTSANIHGESNPYSIDQIVPCDLILDSGSLPEVPPSKVVDCTNKMPRTVRE